MPFVPQQLLVVVVAPAAGAGEVHVGADGQADVEHELLLAARRRPELRQSQALRLDAEVRGERLEQADRDVDERSATLQLVPVEREDLVEVRSLAVALLDRAQVGVSPRLVGELHLEVAHLALPAVRNRDRHRQVRDAVRRLDAVAGGEAASARILHRVEVDEDVGVGELVEVAGPGNVVRLVDGDDALRHRRIYAPVRRPPSSASNRSLSSPRSSWRRTGNDAGGSSRTASS